VREDIRALVEHFITKYEGSMGRAAEADFVRRMRSIEKYHWPEMCAKGWNVIEAMIAARGPSRSSPRKGPSRARAPRRFDSGIGPSILQPRGFAAGTGTGSGKSSWLKAAGAHGACARAGRGKCCACPVSAPSLLTPKKTTLIFFGEYRRKKAGGGGENETSFGLMLALHGTQRKATPGAGDDRNGETTRMPPRPRIILPDHSAVISRKLPSTTHAATGEGP